LWKVELMPKATFFHLPEEKRNLIVAAAMREFSNASYQNASINQICKRANMAKGSFYQYFADKLDLYVYLMSLAVGEKIRYFSDVLSDFHALPLPEQIRLLFVKGLEFARKHPEYAALGEQFAKETDETVRSAVIRAGHQQSEALFAQMIQNAIAKGEIDSSVDPLALGLLLISMNQAAHEYMLHQYGNAETGIGEKELGKIADAFLRIIFHGAARKTD